MEQSAKLNPLGAACIFQKNWAKVFGIFFLFSILGFGAYFRTIELEKIPGINGDEGLNAVQIFEMMHQKPFDLMMPTGRILSPIYGLLLIITHTIFEPSFWSLRIGAVFAGLLCILLSAVHMRSLALAILIAAHPVLIAYSRIGIEQCLLPLGGLLLLHLVLLKKWKWVLFSFGLNLLLHPVTVFYIPLIAVTMAYELGHSIQMSPKKKIVFALISLIVLGLGLYLEVHFLPRRYHWVLDPKRLWINLTDFNSVVTFFVRFIKLVNGSVAYEQFVGGVPSFAMEFWNSLSLGVFPFLIPLGVYAAWRNNGRYEGWVCIGIFTTVFLFYLLVGYEPFEPGLVRYTVWIIIPVLWSLTVSLRYLIKDLRLGMVIIFIIAGLNSLFFWQYYLKQIHLKNSLSHHSYLTGEVEPKLAAFQWIQSRSKGLTTIVAQDWWTYWPIRYLALTHPRFQIGRWDAEDFDSTEVQNLLRQGTYFIGFSRSDFESLFETQVKNLPFQTKRIYGFNQQELLKVFYLK